jgi:class 3 adenylate cyclase
MQPEWSSAHEGQITVFYQRHLRQTLKEFPESEEIETAGDSFLLIFAKPSDAVRFALLVQARFRAFRHEKQVGLLERIGIHLGEVVIKEHETEANGGVKL